MLTRRTLLAGFSLVAVPLAGCLGGDAGGATTDTTTRTTTTQSTTAPSTTATTDDGMATPTVTVADTDLGAVLADAAGVTLYLFTRDTDGESVCYDDCASTWPPLLVEDAPTAGDGVSATLGTHERRDGSLQVTADGWPLYYFAGDDGPGETNGQGLGDVWFVLAPDGSVMDGSATTTTAATTTTQQDPY